MSPLAQLAAEKAHRLLHVCELVTEHSHAPVHAFRPGRDRQRFERLRQLCCARIALLRCLGVDPGEPFGLFCAFRRFFVCGLQSLPGLIPLTVAPTVPHRRDMEGPVVIASALPFTLVWAGSPDKARGAPRFLSMFK